MSNSALTAELLAKQRGRFHDALLGARELSPLQRVVGLVLLGYVNRESGTAWPSVATLARRAGLPERSVRDALAGLVTRGWYAQVGRGRTNRYEPLYEKIEPTLFGSDRKAEPANDSNRARRAKRPPAESNAANDSNIGHSTRGVEYWSRSPHDWQTTPIDLPDRNVEPEGAGSAAVDNPAPPSSCIDAASLGREACAGEAGAARAEAIVREPLVKRRHPVQLLSRERRARMDSELAAFRARLASQSSTEGEADAPVAAE